jgi:flagellar protein FliO/FliZ
MKSILAIVMMISLNVFAAEISSPEIPSATTVTTATDTATSAPTAAATAATDTTAAVTVATIKTENAAANLLKVKESEIPVHLGNDKKATTGDSTVFKVLMSLSLIGILGCGAFFWFRKYAKKGNAKNQATQIKVLTQHYLGPKKSLAIIRVAGESILVGVTDHNISLIKELSLLDEDIPEETPKKFQTVFSMDQNESVGFDDGVSTAANKDLDSHDEFSFSGIKDFVSSKLKNMRSIE